MADDPEDRRRALALFRHAIIADLEFEELARGELSSRIAALATRTFRTPSGDERRFTERTLWSWWSAYKQGGLEALLPKERRDCGISKAITPDLLEAAVAARKEIPSRSTSTVIDRLERQGVVEAGKLRRSTLDRHLERAGASRRRMKTLGDKRFIRMLFSAPNQFWLGDYHEANILFVRGPRERFKTVHMGAIIDHYAKLVAHARWYDNEQLATIEDSLKKAILKRGLPDKFYVDNGSVYRSHDFEFALAHLGIKKPRSASYAKEAHGAIERFNRTVVEQFEPEIRALRVEALERINLLFEAWLEERYHLTKHEATGEKPLDRFAMPGFLPRYPDPVLVQDTFRVRGKRKVHPKTSTVEVDGVHFLVETFLRGRWVTVHYDPHRLEDVLVFLGKQRVQRALPATPNEPPLPRPERPAASPPAFDYLGALRAEYDRRVVAEAKKVSLSEWTPQGDFVLADFLAVCATILGKALSAYDREGLTLAFHTVGPFSEATTRIALEHALRLLGRGLHVSVYTHYLKVFHLAAIKAPKEEGTQ